MSEATTAATVRENIDNANTATNEEIKAFVPKKIDFYEMPNHTDDVAMDIMHRKHVMLIGHTGTGKTSLIEQLAARLNQAVVKVNMNGQMSISDFVGFFLAENGAMRWIDGVLPYCMRNGFWLILDEFDFADAALLSVLHSVTEKEPKLVLKEKGHELVPVHPKFRIFATANAVGAMQGFRHLYQGTRPMNVATLARWQCYLTDYLEPKAESVILQKTVNSALLETMPDAEKSRGEAALIAEDKLMREEAAMTLVKVAGECRMAFTKEEIQFPFSFRMLADFGERLMLKKQIARKKNVKLTAEQYLLSAAEIAVFSKITPEDKEFVKGIMTRVCLGRASK